ncbi:MAG: N-6 DNA methylase, partial [Bacteroidetes bacterium]|nr:N-6 DNA methylase [Bacteroidota bacterium]
QDTEKWLVSELNFAPENIDIEYPIHAGSRRLKADIVVLRCERANNLDQHKDIIGIVECKQSSIESAEDQLKTYMAVSSSCEWGVAATKDARQFYRRLYNGEIERIHAIPPSGMTVDQVERLRKSDLKPAINLKLRFKSILFHLYSNTNIQSRTRLCNEMTKILFCKIYDERLESDVPIFQCTPGKSYEEVKQDIQDNLWKQVLSDLGSSDAFKDDEGIILDADSVAYVVGELERVSLLNTGSDVVGAAFEVFAERYFIGEKGEFFTPRIAVINAIKFLDPHYSDTIIDPACGSGGFLIQALEYVWKKIETTETDKEWKTRHAPDYIFGIDKEPDLVKVARSYMALVGDGHTKIVDADSLKPLEKWSERSRVTLTNSNGQLKKFDIVVTNPPFGSQIKVNHRYILSNYELGHQWRKQKSNNRWIKSKEVVPTAPQILFLELCIKLLKDGGTMCIVLPESVFGNPKEGYVRQWLLDNVQVLAVWDCPNTLFLPHTSTKTCMLFLKKNKVIRQEILMSHINKVGHDQRGAEIRVNDESIEEDFSLAIEDWRNSHVTVNDSWRGKVSRFIFSENLDSENRLVPRDFILNDTQNIDGCSLLDLELQQIIDIKTIPCNVRAREYSQDGVPFLRTSDLGVWEKRPTQKRVPLEVYNREKARQDVQVFDILMVKDGGQLIGEAVILLEDDTKMLIQGHFYKIRVMDPNRLNPFFLYWALVQAYLSIQSRILIQSTLGSMTKDRIREIIIPFPDQEQQKVIGEEVEHILRERKRFRNEFEKITFT